MAQARMPLWAAEDMDEELNDVDVNIVGNYGQSEMYDEASQARLASQMLIMEQQKLLANAEAFAAIPDPVKRFIVHFHQAVKNNNLPEITVAYESGWNRLTEKFFAKTEWPDADLIAPLVNNDHLFLILYRELYYRHIYSRIQPDIDDRFHSYENSCELFNYLLNSDGPVQLELPEQWLWDIVDEFIYQFQSFCVWRSKVKSKNDEEILILSDASQESGLQIWSAYSVLNVLYSLIQKSRINDYIVAQQAGKSEDEIAEIVGEYGAKPLYRLLGYFSIIGLLRVHVLLGDFTLALKVMDGVELSQKNPFTRVTACTVATYYYVGFCYLMLRRYPDAIRTFVSVLNFILRMRQYHTRSYQYDQINKTADRMYALFAICSALSPTRLDDNIANVVKERYGEQLGKMARGEEGMPAFEELFTYACPKFIAANPPPYEDPDALAIFVEDSLQEPAARHLALFLADVRAHAAVPTMRSFLKLYTSLDAGKLADILDADEEEMVQQMMAVKAASRCISRVGGDAGSSLLNGQMIVTSDMDFVINENMVHVAESTVGRRFAGWFIRNTEHATRVLDGVRAAPLPTKPAPAQAAAAAAPESEKPTPAAPVKTVAWGAK
ncbi:hypothetical protein PENSPDRAFT_622441 [Peniophora sp. CONT]|nr:hypothetical protein PENSPDRAFT_622441 [Peniophora sp. CONT]